VAASRFSLEATISLIDKYSNPLGAAGNATIGFSDKVTRQFSRADKSANRLTGSVGNLVKGILGADIIRATAGKIKDFGVQAIQLGSDLTEVQNVVDVTFGKMSKDIDTFSQTALNQFGLSELQVKKFSGTFGALIKSSDIVGVKMKTMSTGLTGLTGDFASFYNLPHEMAFTKIRAGISGETEPLKQLGINMSVANLQAFALSKGINKSYKEMTQAEKVLLRYNFLMAKSKDAQGDFSRTLDTSFANQMRVAQTRLNEAMAKTTFQILPIMTDGLKRINEGLTKIDPVALGQGLKTAIDGFILLGKAIYFMLPAIKAVAAGFLIYRAALLSVTLAKKAMQGLSFILYLIQMRSVIKLATIGHWAQTKALISQKAVLIKTGILWAVHKIKLIATTAAQWALTTATNAWAIVSAIATSPTMLLGAAIAFLTSPITLVIAGVALLAYGFYRLVNATGGIKNAFVVIGKTIMKVLLSPINLVMLGLINLFKLMSKIPKIGGAFKMSAKAMSNLQKKINKPFIITEFDKKTKKSRKRSKKESAKTAQDFFNPFNKMSDSFFKGQNQKADVTNEKLKENISAMTKLDREASKRSKKAAGKDRTMLNLAALNLLNQDRKIDKKIEIDPFLEKRTKTPFEKKIEILEARQKGGTIGAGQAMTPQSPVFLSSPASRGINNTITRNNNTNGRVDVNFNNAPAGTSFEQSGTMPPGLTMNTGVDS